MKTHKTLPDGIRIVEYDDSIAQALADMWNRSGDSWGGDTTVTTAEKIIGDHRGGAFFNVFVAMLGDEAIGYCSFDRYYKDEDTAYVHLLNVRPDYHGKKIGKELVLMCVNETIARGMPRVDIHTWPGNTKAVPLYKKCGFLWEDRSDSTHLSNYIPTVLGMELFADFFTKADWYADSTRVIDIKPDGVKENGFEFYGYRWAKDGESLAVGFEKTGRRVRYVETDDYRIELTAQGHELAFGLEYGCAFNVVNKSGKELTVEIAGKSDGTISFDYAKKTVVTDSANLKARFFINPVADELDPWRMHPCVLADVIINGKRCEFGLGIEPKFPLTVSLSQKRLVSRPGFSHALYINIKSALPGDARVSFSFPDNALTAFDCGQISLTVGKGRDAMIQTTARVLACGYAALPVTYSIAFDDGRAIEFTRPLHIVNQGLEGAFAYETDTAYGAASGPWRLTLDKRSNSVAFSRVPGGGWAHFNVPRLGQPFSDEFNLMPPADVRVRHDGPVTTLEADYPSKQLPGAMLTEIYDITASGTVASRHLITNNGAAPRSLYIRYELFTNICRRAVLHYDGGFHETADDTNYGFSNLQSAKIDENWLFEADRANPAGLYWPSGYQPAAKWGDTLMFELATGELGPGERFETQPTVYISGLFTHFNDFRNYVLGINNERLPLAHNHLEIVANRYNPVFTGDTLTVSARNNRLKIWQGDVCVSSPDGLFDSQRQTNGGEDALAENAFTLAVDPAQSGVHTAIVGLRFAGYEADISRALLVKDPGARIATDESDGVYTVTNCGLCYKAAPAFSDAVYSLSYAGHEWLFSSYPQAAPYTWWNPFVGGIQANLPNMSNSLILREKRRCAFAEETDNFGNLWSGLRTDVTIEQFDEHKGLSYSQYFLTIPGVPVLCVFTRLHNDSGGYRTVNIAGQAFLSGKDGLAEYYADIASDDRQSYRLRAGKEDIWLEFDRLAAVSRRGGQNPHEKLYFYTDCKRDGGWAKLDSDINFLALCSASKLSVGQGESRAATPVFIVLTQKGLTADALCDLGRISFK